MWPSSGLFRSKYWYWYADWSPDHWSLSFWTFSAGLSYLEFAGWLHVCTTCRTLHFWLQIYRYVLDLHKPYFALLYFLWVVTFTCPLCVYIQKPVSVVLQAYCLCGVHGTVRGLTFLVLPIIKHPFNRVGLPHIYCNLYVNLVSINNASQFVILYIKLN